MIPDLIEEYLRDCPIGEFAPVGRGGVHWPFTKMMALVVVLMKIYRQKIMMEESSPGTPAVLSNLTDCQVQEAMAAVVREAVTDRWDRRTFAFTSEDSEGGDRVRLTVFAECGISGTAWAAAVGELKASGRRMVEEATCDAALLTRPSRTTTEAVQKQKLEWQTTEEIVRLSPDDEDLHFLAQEIGREKETSRSRRPMPEPDEGRHVDRCYNVREVLGGLYRAGQLDLGY